MSTTAEAAPIAAKSLIIVRLDELHDNPENPRASVKKDEGFKELVASIKSHGVMSAPLVRPRPGGGYEIVAGHRRTAGARAAGQTEIHVEVRELDDVAVTELAIVENLMRADLTPVEEARGYFRLVALGDGRSVKSISQATGRSQKYVSERLALMELPKDVLKHVDSGTIALGAVKHLRAALDAEIHPDEFKALVEEAREGRNIENVTERTIAKAKRERVIDEIRTKAESRGVELVVHRGSAYDLPRNVAPLDTKAVGEQYKHLIPEWSAPHKGEPCEGIVVIVSQYGSDAPKSGKVCLDTRRHSKAGESEVKIVRTEDPAAAARKDADREAREKAAIDKERKIGLLTDLEGAVKPGSNEARDLMCHALIGALNADQTRLLAMGLVLEPDFYDNPYGERKKDGTVKQERDWLGPIMRYAAQNGAALWRVGTLAAAVKTWEFYVPTYSTSLASAERLAQASLNALVKSVSDAEFEPAWSERDAKLAAEAAERAAEPEAEPEAGEVEPDEVADAQADQEAVYGETESDEVDLGMDAEDAEAVREHVDGAEGDEVPAEG